MKPGRYVLDFDLPEDSVVGGEDLSSQELSVEVDLFFVTLGRSAASSPSLLELPDDPPPAVDSVPPMLKDALDLLRMLKSLRNEGITADAVLGGAVIWEDKCIASMIQVAQFSRNVVECGVWGMSQQDTRQLQG